MAISGVELFRAQLEGKVGVSSASLGNALDVLLATPVPPADKKQALLLWLDRAGVKLEPWMVRYVCAGEEA